MAVEIQVRRGAASVWTSVNPTLAQGEWGLETDTDNLKIGNGTSAWTALPYQVYPYASVVNLISAASVASEAYAFSITNAASVSLAASIAAGGGGSGSVSSVFGRTGAVAAQVGDYSAYYDLNGKASAASTAAIAASDPAGLAASVKALSLLSANNLSDVADAGTSRQDIHIPALTSVAAVQTASVGSFTGLPVVDGYQTANGDAILVTSAGVNNGPWLMPASGSVGSWTRPTEFATGASVHGRTVAVMNGTIGANQLWQLNTPTVGILVGTTTQSWALSGNSAAVFNVKTYGATGNGSTNDTVAIKAAITAASVNGGIVYLPQGTYAVSSVMAINSTAISLIGAGSDLTAIQPISGYTGIALKQQTSPSTFVNTPAGKLGGFTIDGTNAGAGAIGLQIGDTLSPYLEDVAVQNFSAASCIGINWYNTTFWTERTTAVRLRISYNTIGQKFSYGGSGTSSFARTHLLDTKVDVGVDQLGTLFAGGVVYNAIIDLHGNISTGGTFVELNSGTGGAVATSQLYWQAEGVSGATGILIEANDNIQACVGLIDLSVGSLTNVDNNGNSSFTGHFNCPGWGVLLADNAFSNGDGPLVLGSGFALGPNMWGGSGAPGGTSGVLKYVQTKIGDVYIDSAKTGGVTITRCTTASTPGTTGGVWATVV